MVMNVINDKYSNERYYSFKLKNGLNLYIVEKPNFKTVFAAYFVKAGSLDLKGYFDNKLLNFNSGIAHFLEHLLFKTEKGDVISQFSNFGYDVNAYTSTNETVYYFTGVKNKIKKAINLLLSFTNSLIINKDDVDAEREIIRQELLMYQNSENKLINESYKELYNQNTIRYDIGGDDSSIDKIDLDELYMFFNSYYTYNNSNVLIISPFKYQKILNIIEEFDFVVKKENIFNEFKYNDQKIGIKNKKITINNSSFKRSIGYRLDNFDKNNYFYLELLFKFALEMVFSELNSEYEKWINKKIINDYFSYDVNFNKVHQEMIFYFENDKITDLNNFIEYNLKNFKFDEHKLIQLKNRFINKHYEIFDSIEEYGFEFIKSIINDRNMYEIYDIVKKIKIEEIIEIVNKIDFSNYSIVSINGE